MSKPCYLSPGPFDRLAQICWDGKNTTCRKPWCTRVRKQCENIGKGQWQCSSHSKDASPSQGNSTCYLPPCHSQKQRKQPASVRRTCFLTIDANSVWNEGCEFLDEVVTWLLSGLATTCYMAAVFASRNVRVAVGVRADGTVAPWRAKTGRRRIHIMDGRHRF